MSDYTPGPWRACGDGNCRCKTVWAQEHPIAEVTAGKWGDSYPVINLEDGGRRAVPTMTRFEYGEVPENVAKANSLLIAAAPDLLEAAHTLLTLSHKPRDCSGEWECAWEQLRTAVAKARGDEQ